MRKNKYAAGIMALILCANTAFAGTVYAKEAKDTVYTFVGTDNQNAIMYEMNTEVEVQADNKNASNLSNSSPQAVSVGEECLEIPMCRYGNVNTYCQYVVPSQKKLSTVIWDVLSFVNYETGENGTEYVFDTLFNSYYKTDELLYIASLERNVSKVQVYDVEQAKIIREIQTPELLTDTCSNLSAVGVSKTGDIYLASYNTNTEGKIWIYDAEGNLKTSLETPGKITRFYGFTSDGVFCYEVFYNYRYWGYDHEMAGLCVGLYKDGQLTMEPEVVSNMFQWGYGNHVNSAEVLSDDLVADYLGNVYQIEIIDDKPELNYVGGIQGRDYNNASGEVGSKTLYRESDNLVVGEAEPNILAIFDPVTYEKLKYVNTSYDIFNIMWCGDKICCVELDKTAQKMYVEMFDISDFTSIKTEVIHLNEQSNYAQRSKETIANKYVEALGNSVNHTLLEEKGSSVSPYKEGVLSEETKEVSLKFTNYVRWLGGLSAYQSADDTAWTESAKAAVLASAASREYGYHGHEPLKPSDMTNEFYADAQNAIDGNLYYMSNNNTIRTMVNVVRGWNDDVLFSGSTSIDAGPVTYRQGIDSPTHRFSFQQRGGSEISYGFTQDTAVQKYEYAQYDPNETGTILETGNNEMAYVWPAAGYFPEEEIEENAKWSINLNTDKLCFSNKNPIITITDTNTNETWVRDAWIPQSGGVGMELTSFWGYYLYFTGPEVDDYSGRTFEVQIENLATAAGNPVTVTYTTSFFSYSDVVKDPMLATEEDDEKPITNPFTDVSDSMYYYQPVLWALENNVTAGINAMEFAPEQSCTRGQVVTFLWRAMGCPEPTTTKNPFVDVDSNQYYYKAVLWALENGITAGINATQFAPDETVTRGQFVTFLHRAENKPSYSVSNPFSDVPNTYYYDAVLWAYENGVTAGTDSTHFSPEDFCTRGQVVTFLYRALNAK